MNKQLTGNTFSSEASEQDTPDHQQFRWSTTNGCSEVSNATTTSYEDIDPVTLDEWQHEYFLTMRSDDDDDSFLAVQCTHCPEIELDRENADS